MPIMVIVVVIVGGVVGCVAIQLRSLWKLKTVRLRLAAPEMPKRPGDRNRD
ncbi:MAG TPA: hypothetical protein VFE47_20730 [Tepidisphaeraceae bacterium]|nr:hypothetical protein [Tepidisphaeraceae bacterium]